MNFKYFIMNENEKIKESKELAIDLHAGQKRKFSGESYFTHVDAVAKKIWNLTFDPILVAASYLHDSLEDCDIYYNDIVERFGIIVAGLVDELTSIDIDKNKKTKYLIKKMKLMSSNALTIKLVDRLHNLNDINIADDKWRNVYILQTKKILRNINLTNNTHIKLSYEIWNILNDK